ncbi:MAG: hypothetical protein JW919_07480 [Candidatus Omnitrophica bacterium]|nr:hypothetical protein [Candidatus Omnitrophota bacterium]
MKFGWETDKEKIERSIKVPPKKKMEWLQAVHEMLLAVATPGRRNIFWKLRGIK